MEQRVSEAELLWARNHPGEIADLLLARWWATDSPRANIAYLRLIDRIATIPERNITSRQLDILHAAALGDTNREIAVRLWLTNETIKTHLKEARARLGAKNTTHAVVLAMKRELIHP